MSNSPETQPVPRRVDLKYLDGAGNGGSTTENPFQALNSTVKQIELQTGLRVIPAHLGNPMAQQFDPTNQAMGYYYTHRRELEQGVGYQDVAGDPDVRRHLADTFMLLNRFAEENANPARPPEDHLQLTERNILGTNGGTGALNLAIRAFDPQMTVLVPEPAYAPWFEIAKHLERHIETYPLNDRFLLDGALLEQSISKAEAERPGKPIVIISHNPHNPTSKTLTKEEAEDTAASLNELCAKHPNLFIIQEDLYLATTKPEMGIYTPLPYLNAEARAHTIVLHSPSKMGLAQDRGGVVMAFDQNILDKLRSNLSVDSLGPSHPALLATALTLRHIATGGRDGKGEPGTEPGNYRYQTAQFYQDRLKIVADGLKEIEDALSVSILPRLSTNGHQEADDHVPKGAYYVFPSFAFLKGKPIPGELHDAFRQQHPGRNDMAFRNADDIALALQNAHLLGLQPAVVASGTLFYKDEAKKAETMDVRISTVAPDETLMRGLTNTLKGLVQKTLDADPAGPKVDLGATFSEPYRKGAENDEMLRLFPAQPATPSTRVNVVELLTSKFIEHSPTTAA